MRGKKSAVFKKDLSYTPEISLKRLADPSLLAQTRSRLCHRRGLHRFYVVERAVCKHLHSTPRSESHPRTPWAAPPPLALRGARDARNPKPYKFRPFAERYAGNPRETSQPGASGAPSSSSSPARPAAPAASPTSASAAPETSSDFVLFSASQASPSGPSGPGGRGQGPQSQGQSARASFEPEVSGTREWCRQPALRVYGLSLRICWLQDNPDAQAQTAKAAPVRRRDVHRIKQSVSRRGRDAASL